MKTIPFVSAGLLMALLPLGGCTKAARVEPYEVQGVKVDVPQLDMAFANAAPELQGSTAAFKRFFRYGQYPQALAELDKLGRQPSLTALQKKLIEDLTAQTKEVVAKSTPAPPGR